MTNWVFCAKYPRLLKYFRSWDTEIYNILVVSDAPTMKERKPK